MPASSRKVRKSWACHGCPGVAGTGCPGLPGHQQLEPSWAAPWVEGCRGVGAPASSSHSRPLGAGLRGPRPGFGWRSCRLVSLQKGEEGSILSAVDSPVCNTHHYLDDCVFSLVTHYFYAERGFLTKGKTTAITFISLEQLTHTRNILLFVRTSPVYRRSL